MTSPEIGKTMVFVALISICSLCWAGSVNAPGYCTIAFYLDKTEININQSNEPLTLYGWVNYSGVSVTPFTVHLSANCDVGDVYLSQYEFVFHTPDSIPFDGFINIQDGIENGTIGIVSISGSYQMGGLQTNLAPVMQNFTVLNYNRSQTPDEITERNERNIDLFLITISSIIIILAIAIVLFRRKMKFLKIIHLSK